jgi:SAM-dependent methyltransferase
MDCPVCGSNNVISLGKIKNYEGVACFCVACDTIFPSIFPSDEVIEKYYQGFQFNNSEQAPLLYGVILKYVLNWRAKCMKRKIRKYTESRKLLDFGGGCGNFTAAFSKQGYQAELFELDESAIAIARRSNVQVTRSKSKYGIVFSSHVIEHFKDLHLFFRQVSEHLETGGILIVACPNKNANEPWRKSHLASYVSVIEEISDADFRKTRWFCFDPPRHFYAISKTTIRYLAAAHHFEVVGMFTEYANQGIFYFNNSYTLWGVATLLKDPISYLHRIQVNMMSLVSRLRGHDEGDNLVAIMRRVEHPGIHGTSKTLRAGWHSTGQLDNSGQTG